MGEDFPRGRIQNDGISKYTRPPAFAYFVTHMQVVFQEELSLFHFSINYHMAYQVLGGGGEGKNERQIKLINTFYFIKLH